jgi:glutamine synthetase
MFFNTDRNRTAFLQEINEFRWFSANCSNAMTTLNTIVANNKDFKKEVDALIESKDTKKDDALSC